MRGGYRGRGGRGGGYPPRNLSDTLEIRVSNVRHTVTEEMMRQVFGSVKVTPVSVFVHPGMAPGESSVTAQFASPQDAQAVHQQLNDRNIYNDGNKMTMSYGMPQPAGVLEPYPPYGMAPPPMYQNPPMPMRGGYVGMPSYDFSPMGGPIRGRGRGRGRGMPMDGYSFGAPMMAPSPMPMHMNAPPARTIYLSVTVVPETEPLQSIFVLMEVFGGVVTIRRTQRKKEILTVKCADLDDADNIVRYLRRVPFAGGTVSAKHFPTYVDRHPCTDDGDPNDAATEQFNFTASRHRSPGQRSRCPASRLLKITGCPSYTADDVTVFLNSKGFTPEKLQKDEEGNFTLTLPTVENAVNLIITCQGNICGEERSNVLFLEGPADDAAANAATSQKLEA